MRLSIEGWLEVSHLEDVAEEHAWLGVVDLSSLIGAGDEISEQLFGLSKRHVSDVETTLQPLASSKGLPANPSNNVLRDIERIHEYEAKFGSGEFGGYTFATWEEIKPHLELLTDTDITNEWRLIFNWANQLEKLYPHCQIRFVVWFSW
jgi:hypothetical protein